MSDASDADERESEVDELADDGEVVDRRQQRFGPRAYMPPQRERSRRWVLGGNSPHTGERDRDTRGNSGP